MKTTSPASYTVRPSQGFLGPGVDSKVEVVMQKGADGRTVLGAATSTTEWKRHKFKAISSTVVVESRACITALQHF